MTVITCYLSQFEEANPSSTPIMCDNEDLSLDGSNTGSRSKRNVLSGRHPHTYVYLMLYRPTLGHFDSGHHRKNSKHQLELKCFPGCQWDHKDLTYNVGCVPRQYNRTLVEMDIARAFATWSNYTDLTFTPKTGKVESVTSHILDMSLR